jgi:hypothetical protein
VPWKLTAGVSQERAHSLEEIDVNEKFQEALGRRDPDPFYTILRHTPQGSFRRQEILRMLRERGGGVCVNRSHCLSLRYDHDLVKLLRQGHLVRTRTGYRRSKNTVLVLASQAGGSHAS